MAKYFDFIGYAHERIEKKPGVWVDQIVEKKYFGDVISNSRRLDEVDKVNKDISTSNSISIMADPYAIEHFFAIRFAMWAGVPWTVTDVKVERPRLLLRLGGVYNGPRGETSETP